MTAIQTKRMSDDQLKTAHAEKMAAWRSNQAATNGLSCQTSSMIADHIAAIEREMIRRQSAARRAKSDANS
jgi:hypothetical protein